MSVEKATEETAMTTTSDLRAMATEVVALLRQQGEDYVAIAEEYLRHTEPLTVLEASALLNLSRFCRQAGNDTPRSEERRQQQWWLAGLTFRILLMALWDHDQNDAEQSLRTARVFARRLSGVDDEDEE